MQWGTTRSVGGQGPIRLLEDRLFPTSIRVWVSASPCSSSYQVTNESLLICAVLSSLRDDWSEWPPGYATSLPSFKAVQCFVVFGFSASDTWWAYTAITTKGTDSV